MMNHDEFLKAIKVLTDKEFLLKLFKKDPQARLDFESAELIFSEHAPTLLSREELAIYVFDSSQVLMKMEEKIPVAEMKKLYETFFEIGFEKESHEPYGSQNHMLEKAFLRHNPWMSEFLLSLDYPGKSMKDFVDHFWIQPMRNFFSRNNVFEVDIKQGKWLLNSESVKENKELFVSSEESILDLLDSLQDSGFPKSFWTLLGDAKSFKEEAKKRLDYFTFLARKDLNDPVIWLTWSALSSCRWNNNNVYANYEKTKKALDKVCADYSRVLIKEFERKNKKENPRHQMIEALSNCAEKYETNAFNVQSGWVNKHHKFENLMAFGLMGIALYTSAASELVPELSEKSLNSIYKRLEKDFNRGVPIDMDWRQSTINYLTGELSRNFMDKNAPFFPQDVDPRLAAIQFETYAKESEKNTAILHELKKYELPEDKGWHTFWNNEYMGYLKAAWQELQLQESIIPAEPNVKLKPNKSADYRF